MKRFPQALLITFAMMFAISAYGQEPPDQGGPPPERPADRMNILRELGLSQDQVRQMRLNNQDIRTKRQAARRRMNEAGRNLDQTIYADTVDQALFAQHLKEFQDAQAEMATVNFENELAIRKVLTPEQLVRFREIRQKFNEKREDFPRQRQNRRGNGGQRMPPSDKQPINNFRPAQRSRP